MTRLAEQLPSKSFQYYDWNASTGDGRTVDRQQAYENDIKGNGNEYVMLLCHDSPSKQSAADALPDVIKFYKEQGYTFAAIDRHTLVMHQGIGN